MAKNPQLKKAYATDEYTPEMVVELMRCKKDPIYFMKKYIKIQHPKRGTIKFNMFEYQERFVQCMHTNRYVITLQPRQCGKTLTAAMYLLWFAMFYEPEKTAADVNDDEGADVSSDATILIASKNQAHALEIAERVRFAYEELPNWIKPGLKYWNRHSVWFDNGSRIVSEATTEKTGRGLSITKMYLDELAFINPRIQEALWASLAPTLSTGGSAIISSTPNGDTELFAQLWRGAMSRANNDASGGNSTGPTIGFVPFSVHWREHPERDDSYWEEMVALLGELKTRQEVGCLYAKTPINTSIGTLTMEQLYATIGEQEVRVV